MKLDFLFEEADAARKSGLLREWPPYVKSFGSPTFWTLTSTVCPRRFKRLAVKNYNLWQQNPNHPSLHFRRLKGSEINFTVRIGDGHRAIGRRRSDVITWVWIGSHEEYDRIRAARLGYSLLPRARRYFAGTLAFAGSEER